MDHSLLAGGFCTFATIILNIEIIISKPNKLNKKFVLFYSLGCSFWALLGVVTGQVALFMIGMTQFLALVSSYLIIYKGKKYAAS